MITVSRLLSAISSHILGRLIVSERIQTPLRIFLGQESTKPESNCIYISDIQTAHAMLSLSSGCTACSIFISDASGHDISEFQSSGVRDGINIILTDMTLPQLHNALGGIIHMHNSFDVFMEASFNNSGDGKNINILLDMLGAPAFITDARMNILFSAPHCTVFEGEKIFSPGIDCPEYSQFLENDLHTHSLFPSENGQCFVYKLREKRYCIGFLFVYTENPTEAFIAQLQSVGEYIRSHLITYNSFLYQGRNPLGDFIRDLTRDYLQDAPSIRARFFSLEHPVHAFYNTIVIEFDQSWDSLPSQFIINRLIELFPNQNIGRYENKLIVLLSSDNFVIKPKIDYDRFEEFLENFGAYAGIANNTSNRLHLKMAYLFACQLIHIVKEIPSAGSKRIFLQSEHMVHLLFNNCYHSFSHFYGHNNIIYIAHPGIMALSEYDRCNSDNLAVTLRVYLQNDRQVAKAAAQLHMHRNTFAAKLKKICQLLKIKLDDPELMFQYNLSYHLLDFYDHIQNMDRHAPFSDSPDPYTIP